MGSEAVHAPATPESARSRPARWRGPGSRVLAGAALVVLWAAWLVVLWVGQVRLVPLSTLEDDLASGRVLAHREVRLDRDSDTAGRWSGSHEVSYVAVDDRGVLTGDPDESGVGVPAVAYWVDGRVATQRVVDPGLSPTSTPDDALARLRAAGVPADTRSGSDVRGPQWVGRLSAVLFLMSFGLVVLGPRPGRGTRWFWFWMLWTPLALGPLAYAVCEMVRPTHPDHAAAGRRRLPWLAGMFLAWLGGGLLALGLTAGADLAPVLLVRP